MNYTENCFSTYTNSTCVDYMVLAEVGYDYGLNVTEVEDILDSADPFADLYLANKDICSSTQLYDEFQMTMDCACEYLNLTLLELEDLSFEFEAFQEEVGCNLGSFENFTGIDINLDPGNTSEEDTGDNSSAMHSSFSLFILSLIFFMNFF
eukprot:snap_masked-scaffold_54-processed-gene-0.20-mRNA-1 protein AED:1.00 eAED:1.00 QI:0/-1/0/0/-1/1/1/0/150